MKALGTQHIAEFINCNFADLNNPEILEKILSDAIIKSGLHFVKIISHKFEPVGVTILAIISESHIGIHTYPESNHISLDVFTCSDSLKQLKLIDLLRNEFRPDTFKIAEIQRGNPIELADRNRITSVSSYGFEVKYIVDEVIYSGKSRYQDIEIIRNPVFGKMLFLDKDLQTSESDYPVYNAAMLEPVKNIIPGQRVLILGGGDGSLLQDIISLEPAAINLVDIDTEVIQKSSKYLEEINKNAFANPLVEIYNSEALEFLKSGHRYDIIIYDLTMAPEAFTRRTRKDYLSDLFENIARTLSPNGALTLQAGSLHDTKSINLAEELLSSKFSDIIKTETLIPSFCETWVFFAARKI